MDGFASIESPALMVINNIPFCIAGISVNDDNLGDVESFKPIDSSKKWIFVNSEENYCNIPKQGGSGSNCFFTFVLLLSFHE